MKPRLHFDIGRITLHGYGPAEKQRFTDSLQASLNRLGSMHHANLSNLKINRLDAGQIRPGLSPEQAAGQVATQLFATIKGPRNG